MSEICPLCQNPSSNLFCDLPAARYWHCGVCDLVFLSPHQRVMADVEHQHYRRHQNSIEDVRYCDFLRRLKDPLQNVLASGAKGLDVGCGPSPVLAELWRRDGFPCAYYDPFFFPNQPVQSEVYDFLTATEVIEHLFDPATFFSEWGARLHPGGWFGVMTRLDRPPSLQFANWHYRRDPTHVCFWSKPSLEYVARQCLFEVLFPVPHVALFRKSGPFLC